MSVFVHAYNKFGEFKQRFPRLKSAVGLTCYLVVNLGAPLYYAINISIGHYLTKP